MRANLQHEPDLTPTPREVDLMAAALEGRHGVHAEHVAQFFMDWNAQHGDAGRSWAWEAVTRKVRQRTTDRMARSGFDR